MINEIIEDIRQWILRQSMGDIIKLSFIAGAILGALGGLAAVLLGFATA